MSKLDESADTVLEMVERAANAGAACPSNLDIAQAIGAKSISSGPKALERLEKRGLIKVERGATSRVVTILATGKRTAGTVTKRHWSVRGVVKSAPQNKPAEQIFREERPAVYRDPCPRCGVRGDIGCQHGWAA